ncbi:CpaF family protein [Bacteriovorax sp. Seq25_V]|uniref:CpaF family protein n=1 Tax=Bacteriovorax sp. Seq25_V TaxID=1201288 RepID=UPI000389DDF9|nr:ATPase, T2SS/T4P/T4SS family [Bacteriovorax sp. Seq25_V]EQC46269.1 type II/IV secretion system protein [Bacteriovorax sp. Seq25_V]
MNPVWKMLEDLATKKGITEIVINGPKSIFVERAGEFIGLNASFSRNDISTFIKEVADYNRKECDGDNPILDGNLPDGSRINIVLEPFCTNFCAITIRKYTAANLTLDDHSQSFGISEQWVPFFKSIIASRMNVIVSGGTGVGKTTFMNMLVREISPDQRIITIEDSLELSVSQINNVRLEAGKRLESTGETISTRELVKNTLRMRPDRIIIGEVRGGEVFDLLQAMNTGHEGSMTSVHANSSVEALSRLETLYLMAGFDLPYHVVRRQMSQAIDFIIQLGKGPGGKRVVKQVLEVNSMEGNTVLTSSILETIEGELVSTGVVPSQINKLSEAGLIKRDYFNT